MSRLYCSTAFVMISLPQIAAAEVTAADVWQNSQDYMTAFGGELASTVEKGDGVITVSDVGVTYQLPFGVGRIDLTVPGSQMTETGDGTVAITFEEPIRYGLKVDITGKGTFSGAMDVTVQEYSIVASGEPRNVTYVWSYGPSEVVIRDIVIETDESIPNEFAGMKVEGHGIFAPMSGETQVHVTSLIDVETNFSMGKQEIQINGSTNNGQFDYIAGMEKADGTSQFSLPRGGMDILNLAAAIRQGLALNVSMQTSGYHTNQVIQVDGEVQSQNSSNVGDQLVTYALDQNGLRMKGNFQDFQLEFQDKQIPLPFPVALSSASGEFDLALPLSQADDLQDFTYNVVVRGIEMQESLWALFDPAKALPRDGVNLTTDFSGKVLNKIEWLDFLTVKATIDSGEVPIEIHELKMNNLLIEAAGVSLTGTGSAEFDNSELANGGAPKPSGTADITLKGGNGLLDKLVSMGLISDQDAMGARMGVAVFTAPDPDAEDVLKSHLEMTKEGHILANGQRIQ